MVWHPTAASPGVVEHGSESRQKLNLVVGRWFGVASGAIYGVAHELLLVLAGVCWRSELE